MKKFLTLFVCLFLVSLYTTVSAQQKFFVWKDGGIRNIIYSEEIDSVSFSVGPWLFDILTPEASAVTTQSFTVIPKVTLSKNIKYIQEYYQCGVCYSQSNHMPTIEDICLATRYYEENVCVTAEKLIPNTTYYYRTYVKFLDDVYYGNVMSVTTLKGDRPEPKIINEHSFVDLGLPSGLLWADRNIGASSALVDGGDYFAWGETEPKETYSKANYKWWNGSFTKYNSFDHKLILESEDDAATVNWGKECRTPSIAEFRELVNYCTWQWLQSDNFGPIYRVFGPNGNYIDLYCNGYKTNDGSIALRGGGYYMANSICENTLNDNKLDYTTTNYLFLNSGLDVSTYGMGGRILGVSVRPVANK